MNLALLDLEDSQLHHGNPPTSTPEDQFRISLYDEFLSHVVVELQDRFGENPAHDIALDLLYLPTTKEVQQP